MRTIYRNIIVIGASADRFDAIKTIVSALPRDLDASVFIAWHMSPHPGGSILQGILNGLRDAWPADYATDREPIQPHRIYIAPPDHHLLLEEGLVRVTQGPKENTFRSAIDPLFRSAAIAYGAHVIGVMLSGALDDGTAGLWAIKQCGGLAVVHDTQDAEMPSMLKYVLRPLQVNYITSIAEIGKLLEELVMEPVSGSKEPDANEYEKIKTEVNIAIEGKSFDTVIPGYGNLSPYTCPECHSVLMSLAGGNHPYFRCHMGHAFSAGSLLASLTENIEKSLWGAISAIRESAMLLNYMGDRFTEVNEPKFAAINFKNAIDAEQRAVLVRQAIFDHQQPGTGQIQQQTGEPSGEPLHESEERLRITMESATDYAIITLDTKGNITSWSKGAEIAFEYSEAEAKGKYTDIIFTPEDRETGAPEKEIAQAIRNGRAEDERWHIRKDGSRIYMSGVMAPIIGKVGLVGFVKVARDMTGRKLIEQEKDDFIGIASHELKTPVTSIRSYVELLHEALVQAGDTENMDLTEKLEVQVGRLTDLMHTLLDTTRITGGQLVLQPETFSIDTLINERVEELEKTYPSRRFIIHATPAPVTADKERITQVLLNFISNALKYSPETTEIIVRTEVAGNEVTVSVEDFGKGIPPESRYRVFDRFYRESENDVNTYPGLGLGLYIASQIIKQHKGKIGVTGKPGHGSVFSFTLPLPNE